MATEEAHKVEDMRKRSVGAIEVNDPHGRRRTIDVADLNEADLALAEQFGYHPVSAVDLFFYKAVHSWNCSRKAEPLYTKQLCGFLSAQCAGAPLTPS